MILLMLFVVEAWSLVSRSYDLYRSGALSMLISGIWTHIPGDKQCGVGTPCRST